METETWQPGTVIPKNKIMTNHKHLTTTNYWAPLNDDADEKDEDIEQINHITTTQSIAHTRLNKWTRRIERRKQMKLVIDSGATSHFVPENMNLPKGNLSTKEVYLPDDTKLQATYRTKLPLKQLSDKAREADILPGLTTPLISVNKLAEEGYTTIFHPGENGVTIHEPGTVKLTTTMDPILQGSKRKGAKLWTIEANDTSAKEHANKVYDLPSIAQTVRYLHAAAGFPTEETWIKAIKKGNYNTWPTITTTIVRRHFPESDETQKGHLKRQQQGVHDLQGCKKRQNHTYLPSQKPKTSTSKSTMSQKQRNTDQTGRFPATSSKGNQYVMVLVEVDGNFIDAEPMKNRSEGAMIKAYQALRAGLTTSGTVKPKTHILDNKALADFKKETQKNCAI